MEHYEKLISELKKHKIVPVIKIEDPGDIIPLGKALINGGLPVAEITFRTAAAAEAISKAAEAFPEMLIGAGTVITPEQADQALEAGARFIVAPGFNPRVVSHVLEKNAIMIPGVNNPSQIEAALEMGLSALKFFPAEASGGLPMLKAMAAPYGDVDFMPTGGINVNNIRGYLENPRVIACGGSWMVPGNLISSGDFAKIEELVREAVRTVS